MPTLRGILKYTPAVVMGLLVVAWVVSAFAWAIHVVTVKERYLVSGFGGSSFECWTFIDPDPARTDQGLAYGLRGTYSNEQRWGGGFRYETDANYSYIAIGLPFPFAITLILPLAIGPFLSFRFRLWHYLAYTALVAVELAFYLRWQD